MLNIGRVVWRSPSMQSSFRLIWVTSTSSGKESGRDCKAVIMARYGDWATTAITRIWASNGLHRLIAAAMTKLHFMRLPTERQCQNLVA